ncbi:hypothetical protein [Larkinella terrae]|uniref:Uncharacterized protein n=1 Tax=Larkinella terrae TaxID=2025311 RepID=A0A7K0EJV7_9BACT|nr:hypothetical protein [Larkinella terrae]MRS61811.1 hypothetical protein [Larkinella terrae]
MSLAVPTSACCVKTDSLPVLQRATILQIAGETYYTLDEPTMRETVTQLQTLKSSLTVLETYRDDQAAMQTELQHKNEVIRQTTTDYNRLKGQIAQKQIEWQQLDSERNKKLQRLERSRLWLFLAGVGTALIAVIAAK